MGVEILPSARSVAFDEVLLRVEPLSRVIPVAQRVLDPPLMENSPGRALTPASHRVDLLERTFCPMWGEVWKAQEREYEIPIAHSYGAQVDAIGDYSNGQYLNARDGTRDRPNSTDSKERETHACVESNAEICVFGGVAQQNFTQFFFAYIRCHAPRLLDLRITTTRPNRSPRIFAPHKSHVFFFIIIRHF